MNKNFSGGQIYEDMAREVLPANVVIKNFDELLSLDKEKINIAVIHHLDYSHAPLLVKIYYLFIKPIVFHNLKKVDAIVVVSKYWKKYLEDRGYKNVHLIYNAFDQREFFFSRSEIREFKERYNFTKPIIYLGNCQKSKGVVEAYKALKDLPVHLVTSGKQKVNLPILNLELNHRDYLRLLKSSDIVISMSLFEEGFCRTSAEAMLSGNPVIGSGLGGMKELLDGGNQIICNFDNLKRGVDHLLDDCKMRESVGERGYEFAKGFTEKRFKNDWLSLIQKI